MVIFAVIIGIIAIMLLGLFYQLGNIEVRQTKDYAEMYIDEVLMTVTDAAGRVDYTNAYYLK